MDWLIGFLILGAFLIVASRRASARKRRERLMAKYGDAEVVSRIIAGTIWQGMSAEQLVDAWGSPAAIDDKVYKTKVVHTYKYAQAGRNRFRRRVRLEGGSVVGWELK